MLSLPAHLLTQLPQTLTLRILLPEYIMMYASREIQRSQVGLTSEISQEKENKSHTLPQGNTLYISDVCSSVDGCQLGKHLSPLPARVATNRELPTYAPCSLWQSL